MDATFRLQQVKLHQIHAEQSYAQGQIRPTALNWIKAYDLMPSYRPAVTWLRQFVEAHQDELLGSLGDRLPGLNPADQQALQLLRANPVQQTPDLPQVPRVPWPPGKVSLALLRKVAAPRATIIEEMYGEKVAQYEMLCTQHQAECEEMKAGYDARCADWDAKDQAVRENLPQMVRLCLGAVERAEHIRQEEERQSQEEERQRQIAATQRQQQQLDQTQRQLQQKQQQLDQTQRQLQQMNRTQEKSQGKRRR